MISSHKPVIFIGVQKTGTTSLQFGLFSRHPQITYLGGPYDPTHRRFAVPPNANLKAIGQLVDHVRRTDSIEFDFQACRNIVTEHIQPLLRSSRIPLIFEERFSASYDQADRYLVAKRLFDVLGPCKIMMNIRSQFTVIPSFYVDQFLADNPMQKKFEKWISNDLNNHLNGYLMQFKYYEFAKIYEEIFGRNNIGIFMFEEFRDDYGAYIRKVCEFMDIEPLDFSNPSKALHLNERLRRGVWIKRKLVGGYESMRKATGLNIRLSRYLPFNFSDIESILLRVGRKIQVEIPDGFRDTINEYYKYGNRSLLNEYNLDLSVYDYPI